MDSFRYYLNKLKNFSPSVYRNSICVGNIAFILAKNACRENYIWIREAGYLCDIGSTQVGPIYLKANNTIMLKDKQTRIKLRNTRRFHVKRSMNMIDCMDDIDTGLRQYYKELVDLHHCLYDNASSYCGHNFGRHRDVFVPSQNEIPIDAQILSAATLLSATITKNRYNFANMKEIIMSMHTKNKVMSKSLATHMINCLPEIERAYKNKTIYQLNITSTQQKQALSSFSKGIFSEEHGAYRFIHSRKRTLQP